MWRFSKRHYALFLLIIALILRGINLGDFCYDIVDTFTLGGIGLVFFMILLIVTFYNLYHISIKKEFYDYLTLVFMLVFSLIFYVVVFNPSIDFYKTEASVFQKGDSINGEYTLRMFEDKTFLIEETKNNSSCYSKGKYDLKGNALKLNFNEGNSLSLVYAIDFKQNILIGRDTLRGKVLK